MSLPARAPNPARAVYLTRAILPQQGFGVVGKEGEDPKQRQRQGETTSQIYRENWEDWGTGGLGDCGTERLRDCETEICPRQNAKKKTANGSPASTSLAGWAHREYLGGTKHCAVSIRHWHVASWYLLWASSNPSSNLVGKKCTLL
ncbi:predicted protein [Histoplasma capsulatum H143]|uniref:Uncharacterized protein n=1 Tax=Ajellomyces capsulatus (strain H143) TaxID=544712 RepID=C6H2C7_AJECH|nr:predicted protein [Histoplasma capsulatum H143]